MLPMTDERPLFQFHKRVAQLFIGIHDDGASPCHGLAEGLAGNDDHTGAFGTGMEVDLVPIREEDGTPGGLDHTFRLIGARTFHKIREHGIAGDSLHLPRAAGPHLYIKELHVHVFALCRAADIAVFSGDDADRHALLQ